jgi:hypothetical protein
LPYGVVLLQAITDLRGGIRAEQQYQEQSQPHGQQQHIPQQFSSYDAGGPAAGASPTAAAAGQAGCWGAAEDSLPMQNGYGQQQQYQQQQQQRPAAAAAAGPGNGAASGPPPLLNFRSDKAFMTANEMENRARAQLELQKDLDQQIQEKKRRKVRNLQC